MKFFFVAILTYVLFVHTGFMAINNSIGKIYTPSDEEVNFINVQSTLKGEGLYKGFSIVYPPGRFLLQALFFKIFGTSIPTTAFYFVLIPGIFFPTFLFFLSYKIFRKYQSALISLFLSVVSVFISQTLVYSAYDIHVFAALFFIVLLSEFKSAYFKNIILGILLGVVFLFRIEAGIILTLSIIVSCFEKRKDYKELFPSFIGFLAVWIPMLTYILFTGSIKNFFYDTLYLGLITQPKIMSLPIPPPPVGLIYLSVLIFLFSSSLSLYIKSKGQIGIKIFALFSVLSFISALGRSDEGHMWYAVVWLPFYISYFISCLTDFKKNILKISSLLLIIPISLFLFAFGYFILKFKSAPIFVVLTTVCFLASVKFRKNYVFLILISGILTSLLVFHSLSFLKIRYAGLPTISFKKSLSNKIFQSDGNEIAGLKFSEQYLTELKKIADKLDKENNWLFIYPNHVLFYEYFKLKNPTRYYYHTGETTEAIQKEIIYNLEKTKTNNFIFFPEAQTNQKTVRKWIIDKTKVIQTFKLGDKKVELRKRL